MEARDPIARLILLGSVIAVTAAGAVALKAVTDRPGAGAPEAGVDSSALVPLRGGASLIARPGTPGRQIVDWVASDAPRGQFEVGGNQFDGRSAEPTIEARARLTRLVAILRSDSNVDLLLVGHCDRTSDLAADQALSEARARTVRRILRDSGISSARIKIEGRGGTQPIADDRTSTGRARNERITLELTRHD
jgi:outer membrane protein OmpA-like peptidoglycan-associated protein